MMANVLSESVGVLTNIIRPIKLKWDCNRGPTYTCQQNRASLISYRNVSLPRDDIQNIQRPWSHRHQPSEWEPLWTVDQLKANTVSLPILLRFEKLRMLFLSLPTQQFSFPFPLREWNSNKTTENEDNKDDRCGYYHMEDVVSVNKVLQTGSTLVALHTGV